MIKFAGKAESAMSEIRLYEADDATELSLAYADGGVHAGFPSPAQDYMEGCIDLNKELVRHKSSTFYAKVVGDSMRDAGIEEGDILVIDKQIKPVAGDLIVCYVGGEFAVKYLQISGDKVLLCAANEKYKPIEVSRDSEDFRVWGVVTYSIHSHRHW
jgi:DNA polymerase V